MTNFINQILQNIKKERLLSLSNILVMTFTFVVLGIFINVIVLTQTGLRYLEDQAQLTVFFKDDFSVENILKIYEQYKTDSRVKIIKYVSKEDAYLIFTALNKNEPELLESISSSILPASIELQANKIGDLNVLYDEFSKIDGVEDVKFFEDVINTFKFWSAIIYIVCFVLVVVFVVISYTIIISTIRSIIYSRGKELEIMKLVGATNDYVKKPFIYQSMFFGISSALIAGLFFVIIDIVVVIAKLLPTGLSVGFIGIYINPIVFSIILLFILVASGGLLGYFGSNVALKKYLKY